MPSTFFGLQIAYSGLKAANAALNTTANNVANVETEGFSRQQVKTAASESMRVFATYGCAGAGVDTLAIERVRDLFYDEKFRDNETRLGEYERKDYYMSIVETYFTDDNKTGFKSIFDNIVKSLEEVSKNSSSTSTKSTFVAEVKSMADYFNNMAGDLQDLQKDINDEIKVQVGRINSIAEEIATMNKQINVIELTGTTANELRDKRDLLIDKLSQYVDVKVTETPIYNSQNEETGAMRCIVQIAGGQTLVDANEFKTLTCVARNSYEKVYQTDADGLYDIYWNDAELFRLDNAAMGGSLKGLADLRDGNNGNYFNGTVRDIGITTDADGHMDHTVTITSRDDDMLNLHQCNLSDSGGRIIIGAQEYYYKDWNVTYNDDGTVESYIFTMDDDKCDQVVDSSKIGRETMLGSYSKYQGIPYYMSQMNEWVRNYALAMNEIFAWTGKDSQAYTANGERAGILVTANKTTDDSQFGYEELTGTKFVKSATDPMDDTYEAYTKADIMAGMTDSTKYIDNRRYYHITAFNFSVADEVNLDADLLGTRRDSSYGVEECDNIFEAIDTLRDKEKLSFRGYNASGFLEAVLSDVALNTSNARVFNDTYTSLHTVLDNQRTSISGVDSDEEAVNLVKYENAYTLASKMIQTFQEIYDRLILQTGV